MFYNMIVSSVMFHIFEITKPEKTMEKQRISRSLLFVFMLTLFSLVAQNSVAQPVVGLDNWFNHETNAKTGKPFHYLWTDSEFSGYSRWGEIFTGKGAKITTIGKPDVDALGKIKIYIIVDPDTTTESAKPNYFEPDDINAIVKWVKKGEIGRAHV